MLLTELESIFVHIPKTGGQSIAQAFLQHYGLSWEEREPLLMRPNSDPDLGPPRLAHLTARQYVECRHVEPDEWERYYTFSIVRNPWSRVVSLYKWLGYHRDIPFSTFVHERLPGYCWTKEHMQVRPQVDYVTDEGGRLLVDFVGRLETLKRDFNHICDRLGVDLDLPHVNRSRSHPFDRARWHGWKHAPGFLLAGLKQIAFTRSSYADYYSDAEIQAIGDLYHDDITQFGYRFSDLTNFAP